MNKTKGDHALAIIKAGLASVPIIGGAVSSLINDYLPFSTQKSLDTTVDLLQAKIKIMEARINVDSINKDEFVELFKSCYLVIIKTHQREKLNAAAALLVNILLKQDDKEKLSYTELDHYVRCLDSLSIGAIQVLGRGYDIAVKDRAQNLDSKPYVYNFERLCSELPNLSSDLLIGLVSELNGFGLLRIRSTPAITTPHYANIPLELTSVGSRFVIYLLRSEQK